MADHPISQRWAYVPIGVDPKTVGREPLPYNPKIHLEMNKIAKKRRWFDYPLARNGLLANRERRRIGVMLEREGMVMTEKKLYRDKREKGLSVRRFRGRKRAWNRTPMPIPLRPNLR
jgi:putative transposase